MQFGEDSLPILVDLAPLWTVAHASSKVALDGVTGSDDACPVFNSDAVRLSLLELGIGSMQTCYSARNLPRSTSKVDPLSPTRVLIWGQSCARLTIVERFASRNFQ